MNAFFLIRRFAALLHVREKKRYECYLNVWSLGSRMEYLETYNFVLVRLEDSLIIMFCK